MKFSSTISIFVLIFSIYLSTVSTSKCEYDSDDLKESNKTIIDMTCNGEDFKVFDQPFNLSEDYYIEIKSAGSYKIIGHLKGQILINASEDTDVHLILKNLLIESQQGPAILIAGARKVTITLIGDNTLIESEENKYGATIYSLSNLSINGSGNLDIQNKTQKAIYCGKELKLVSGQMKVDREDFYEQDPEQDILSSLFLAKDLICIDDNFNIDYTAIEKETNIDFDSIFKPMTMPYIQNLEKQKECSSAIKRQGYSCCPGNCRVVYLDKSGCWGVHNDKWCGCGCGGEGNRYSCSVSILKKGYKCCDKKNCKVWANDRDGKWGVENGHWCGIHVNCK